MKKLLFLSTLVVVFVSTGFAQAEFGIKGGLTVANVKGDFPFDDNDPVTSFHIGGTARLAVSEMTFAQIGLLYTGAGFKLDDSELDNEPTYIVAPITLRYYPTEELSVYSGLQPGFVVDDDDSANLEKFDLGVPLGAAYDFEGGFSAETSYTFGLTDISEVTNAKNRAFRLGVAYRFNQ